MFSFTITPCALHDDDDTRFLQSSFWASFKSRHGWSALCFNVHAVYEHGKRVHDALDGAADGQKRGCMSFACSVLVRKIAKRFSLAYIPMMPPVFNNGGQMPLSDKRRDAQVDDALQASCMPQTSEVRQESAHAADSNWQSTGEQTSSSMQVQNEAAHHANGCVNEYAHFLIEFAAALKVHVPKNTLCVRCDVPLDFSSCGERDFFVNEVKTLAFADRLNIAKSRVDIQPPDTVLLDLQKSEEELLNAMKSKWRYNIRLAEKKGVVVKAYRAGDAHSDASGNIDDALDIFYELYKTTASRDGIAIHAKRYYEDMVHLSAQSRSRDMSNQQTVHSETCGNTQHAESCNTAPLISVYVASHEGEPLAAIITLFSKREAVYLYGASSNVKRNFMSTYLLQWSAIKDAKAYGSSVYDFYGMPPADDKNHPMHGLYLFKTGFGGSIVHRPGSIDVPLSAWYKLYALAENVRAFYHKRVKKILAGRT